MFVGNLDGKVDRKLVYELGCQAGPVLNVTVPAGENGMNKGYAFVEYKDVESATYAIKLFEGLVRLYGRTARVDYGKAFGRSTGALDSLTSPADMH